ncbi:hypothetical protein [Ferrimonas sp. SCSIO 43195]|uniref:hypothetical protein n=1 Tax=Ferrimonas sp. SCSIO 43195 TaxID=2822844 RepID=UPI0020763190|nr:hypothetical protein [Ferrimonas sp. SCSIO 43195]USD36007.1 hypothetical protein J8Z22_13265 [Ferrimonas sp. SCSIO 43195]
MRKVTAVLAAVLLSSPALANDINLVQCQEDPRGEVCLNYLQGAVDGALALQSLQKTEALSTSSISDRALKYRSGKRFKQANDAICERQSPQRDQMVLALDDLASQGLITSQEELSQALAELMSCRDK